MNLLDKWSSPTPAAVYADVSMPTTSGGSEFVRILRHNEPLNNNVAVPKMETCRHVAFADDPAAATTAKKGCEQHNSVTTMMVLRPPLDYLTYAGKRWILDPTQFLEPVNGGGPTAQSSREPSPYRTSSLPQKQQQQPSDYEPPYHRSGDRKSRAQRDLLSTLQARPSFVRRHDRDATNGAADDEAEFDGPPRLNLYSKYETQQQRPVKRSDDFDEPVDDPLFEAIVSKVASDKIIIEDILEPKFAIITEREDEKKVPSLVTNDALNTESANVMEKAPSVLSNIEDFVYGEKIADNFGMSNPKPMLQSPDQTAAVKTSNQPPTSMDEIIPETTPSSAYPLVQEVINAQPNEPVYADDEYSKQYEYQEYDAYDPAGNNNPSAVLPSAANAAAAATVDSNNYAALPPDPNAQLPYASSASVANPAETLNAADQQYQPPTMIYNENNEPTATYATTTDPNQQQQQHSSDHQQPNTVVGEYDQYAANLGDEHQQFAPQNYDISAPDQQQQPAQQDSPYNNSENNVETMPATETDPYSTQQQYATDPIVDDDASQQNPQQLYDQQQAAYEASLQNQQQLQPQEQQQYAVDQNYYAPEQQQLDQQGYAQQPADANAMPYDPNAEYQVAHDGDMQQQPQAQEGVDDGAYYGDQQQQQQQSGDQQYYAEEAPQQQQYDYNNDASQPQPGAVNENPVNYLASEENSAAATVSADNNSAPTESDFDFSVK